MAAEGGDLKEEVFDLTVDSGGGRLDVFVAGRCPGLSRSRVRRLVDDGRVTVGGLPAKSSRVLRAGERVLVHVPPAEPLDLQPEQVPLDIMFEDGDLLVVDKPPGMSVHPAPGQARHTLVNALLAHCPDLAGVGGVRRPGIVHRLDKDTSGLLLVAKNDAAHTALSRQLKERQVEKVYLALVRGRFEPSEGAIEGAIGRDPRNRKRMAVVEGGRAARTEYRVLRNLDGYSLVEVRPSTGRTHQIRVHLAAVGHPVVGDALYGRPSPITSRQFLHAHRIGFRHPADGRWLTFESPLPPDLQQALRAVSPGRD